MSKSREEQVAAFQPNDSGRITANSMLDLIDSVVMQEEMESDIEAIGTEIVQAIGSAFDAAGAADAVQSDLTAHENATGTSVHGLGTASTYAATDFDVAGSAATVAGNLTSHTTKTTDAHGGLVPSSALGTTVATLSQGKLPVEQLPDGITGGLNYKGTWNAATNTPTIVSGEGEKGFFRTVSVYGTTEIDGIDVWYQGDKICFCYDKWEKIDGVPEEVTPTQVEEAIAEAIGNLGTASTHAATDFCSSSDSRLSDARTPSSTLAHGASHASGQSDAITPASIGAVATNDIALAPAVMFTPTGGTI